MKASPWKVRTNSSLSRSASSCLAIASCGSFVWAWLVRRRADHLFATNGSFLFSQRKSVSCGRTRNQKDTCAGNSEEVKSLRRSETPVDDPSGPYRRIGRRSGVRFPTDNEGRLNLIVDHCFMYTPLWRTMPL